MLIIGVIALLLSAALAIVAANSIKPNYARSWMIALITTGLAWAVILYLRLFLPSNFALIRWSPPNIFISSPFLVINYNSWPYAFALITLALAVILTESARPFTKSSPGDWSGTLAITAINLAALLSGDPVTLAISWTLVDIIEVIHVFRTKQNINTDMSVVANFGIRLLSIFALIGATAIGWQVQKNFPLSEIPSRAGLFFLIAAGLRLGVLPINLPFIVVSKSRKGTNLVFLLAPVASSLMLIANLPTDFLILQDNWLLLLKLLTGLAAAYAAGMWLTRGDINEAQVYWIVALSAFALMSALNGNPTSSKAWGVALLTSGSILFLYDPPILRIRFIPLIGLLGLIALPYTPAASGWEGLIDKFWSASTLLLVIAHAMLVAGYLRYTLEFSSTITGLEKHARITFPLGLIIILQTALIVGIAGWPESLTVGNWPAGLISLLIVGLGILAFWKFGLRLPLSVQTQASPFYLVFKRILNVFRAIFSLQWLYGSVGFLYQQTTVLVSAVNRVIEGEGGLLWSFVFLVILITIFLAGITF